ncbi:EAL domain-containing protein [Proteinivorax hydrogeniformans]|uniref:EAL domain-containing protein n=1 Tax=Proteinivorax hydrogeniformans TaxID=1826727 RepID=A0AAU8HSX8_9FIRM
MALTTIVVYFLVKRRVALYKDASQKAHVAFKEFHKTYKQLSSYQEEVKYQTDLNDNIFERAQVIIVIGDEHGNLKKLNPFGEKTFGYKESELMDKKWVDYIIPEGNKKYINEIFERLKQGKELKDFETQNLTKHGQVLDVLWNTSVIQGRETEYVFIGTDLTNRKKSEQALKHLAYHDQLTGLPNRAMLKQIIDKSTKKSGRLALLHLDIDNFKYINDSLGYNFGNIFLQSIANELSKAVKSPDILASLDGDEFAILIQDVQSKEDLVKEARAIKDLVRKRWEVNNYDFFVSVSMGGALYPDDCLTSEDLLRNAEIAMYYAKETGRDKGLLYTEKTEEKNIDYVKKASRIQHAIEKDQFSLYYQPQVSLTGKRITGVEALVRWIHPTDGFVSPGEFIPLAEKTGQIRDIEKWVVSEALNQKKKWEQQGVDLKVSINLSTTTLNSDLQIFSLKELLSSYDVRLDQITFEITETAIISNLEEVIERLNSLKELGVKIALDDFGTGYSSMNYLKKLPIDQIKLDRSFIDKVEKSKEDEVIIKSILYLAKKFNYDVIAEGIETENQLQKLKNFECPTGQGYLFSRPVPAYELNLN